MGELLMFLSIPALLAVGIVYRIKLLTVIFGVMTAGELIVILAAFFLWLREEILYWSYPGVSASTHSAAKVEIHDCNVYHISNCGNENASYHLTPEQYLAERGQQGIRLNGSTVAGYKIPAAPSNYIELPQVEREKAH